MSTLTEQISQLGSRIDNLQALLQGARQPGVLYAMIGSHCVFGCKITQGSSAADMVLAIDGAASGDSAHLNPDRSATPVRPEEYGNIANVYGEVFLMDDVNVASVEDASIAVATAPGTGYHRYDIVYAYVGVAGPALGIAAGTAVLNVATPSDPTLPQGVLDLARVHVEENVTGIADAKITDLRDFAGRLSLAGDVVGPAGVTANDFAQFDGATGKLLKGGLALSTSTSLTENSDTVVASQKAVKAYADALIAAADAMVYKGATDCSSNPNYPAASAGWTYRVSVAGKIGGASGKVVEAGDWYVCNTDGTSSGDEAAQGTKWTVIQANLDGAVIGPASAVDSKIALFDGTTGKLLKDSGVLLSALAVLGANTFTAPQTIPNIVMDGTPNTDLTSEGPTTNTFAAGATITALDLVTLNSSSKWVQTDANVLATYAGLIAISLESKTDTQAMKVALPGSFVRNDAWNWTPGAPLYVSETAAAVTASQPTTTDAAIRVVGFAVTADVIWFQPSPDYITHT